MNDNELGTSRILNAPREQVFEAWTNPTYLQEWWGPHGFKNTFNVFELWPGGEWDFIMHGPDGIDYRNKMVFIEIIKPEKIVVDHVSGPMFTAVVTFEEVSKEKTKYSFKMIFGSKEECDDMRIFVSEPNEQNIDRLEAILESLQ
ncbi:SRPBCC family protein [Bacteriovorax sp. PP10]|uniref:SRPBCC family protein n=1 Tax=Bacteriovorax antarcticus TaxID=3088717 RepID=A0ABU5VWB0_9BACT|nr:SRPBCC family protein [Bacteriovorax sp. PP10]MEA9357358.1 SRPBCC family protein [Bacteriovorax sp. PP10]